MKQLIEFVPIALFFIVFKVWDIYTATAVLMAATVVQMVLVYAIDKKLTVMHKVTLVMVLAFGAMTLGFHDDRFIKWKPTVVYLIMAAILGIAYWVMKKNLLSLLLGSQLKLPTDVWNNLCVAWVGYFIFMAAANAVAVELLSTEQWVNFKIWGYIFPITFFVAQGFYVAKHLKDDTPPQV